MVVVDTPETTFGAAFHWALVKEEGVADKAARVVAPGVTNSWPAPFGSPSVMA